MDNTEAESFANKLLDTCESVQLASINEDGFPRICEMEKVRADTFRNIYFTTLRTSEKARHFLVNSRSAVCYSSDSDCISLIGNIEILDDKDTKDKIWVGEHKRRFVEDESGPLYCILHFAVKEAKIFMNGTHIVIHYH